MNTLFTVLLTIVIFMFIIMVHEFGHFIAAKSLGVLVHEFSIGFGPVLFKKQGKETLYTVRAFPIGGYVKLEGEDESSDNPRSLSNKPVWARLIVMAAGATFNLILGFVVFLFLYLSTPTFPELTVGGLSTDIPNAPAVSVLKAGDEITAINGKKLWYYKDLQFIMQNETDGGEMTLTIRRDGVKQDVTITPVIYEGRYMFGFVPKRSEITFGSAIKYAFCETFFVIRLVIYSLMMLITGKISVTEMSGPIGTGAVIGQAAAAGMPNLFNLFALLSVNIGIFNLIPFPALDGGRIFFLFIELIRRKPIPPEKEGMVHFVGLALLMLLMIFVTTSDIFKLFG